jgi:hypothetical protein
MEHQALNANKARPASVTLPANDVRLAPLLQRHKQRMKGDVLPERNYASSAQAPVLSEDHQRLRTRTEELRHAVAMTFPDHLITPLREAVEHAYRRVTTELHERIAKGRVGDHLKRDLQHALDVLRESGLGADVWGPRRR